MSTASILFKILQSSQCPNALLKSMGNNDAQDFAKSNATYSGRNNDNIGSKFITI